ncbi:hypothetical protein NKI41_30070 [Mesorhizobium sp. M0601]|uniref:DUF7665 family protein n=1 Tax=unclassified Mesorhizobium TaxID=325217 RepID=UPI0033371368
MIADPNASRVAADLEEAGFLSGCDAGRWRIIAFAFPVLDFAISATEPDGRTTEYGFHAELTNFPSAAPLVRIWDHAQNSPLSPAARPQGGPRVLKTFQHWGSDTVYRPWDRMTGPHGNNAETFPHLSWRPERRLTFIFEDLHGILNSNARSQPVRPAA